jgi:hypothetical protein
MTPFSVYRQSERTLQEKMVNARYVYFKRGEESASISLRSLFPSISTAALSQETPGVSAR